MVLSLTSDAEGSARKLAKGQSSVTSDAILAAVLKSLDDDKAEDVVQIDLRGISEIGDHMVICSGRSTRQVAAISEKLKSRLKDDLGILSKVEGKGTGDWVLVDTGDVMKCANFISWTKCGSSLERQARLRPNAPAHSRHGPPAQRARKRSH